MIQNMKEHKQMNLMLLRFWENDKVPTKVGVSCLCHSAKSRPSFINSVVIPHLVLSLNLKENVQINKNHYLV